MNFIYKKIKFFVVLTISSYYSVCLASNIHSLYDKDSSNKNKECAAPFESMIYKTKTKKKSKSTIEDAIATGRRIEILSQIRNLDKMHGCFFEKNSNNQTAKNSQVLSSGEAINKNDVLKELNARLQLLNKQLVNKPILKIGKEDIKKLAINNEYIEDPNKKIEIPIITLNKILNENSKNFEKVFRIVEGTKMQFDKDNRKHKIVLEELYSQRKKSDNNLEEKMIRNKIRNEIMLEKLESQIKKSENKYKVMLEKLEFQRKKIENKHKITLKELEFQRKKREKELEMKIMKSKMRSEITLEELFRRGQQREEELEMQKKKSKPYCKVNPSKQNSKNFINILKVAGFVTATALTTTSLGVSPDGTVIILGTGAVAGFYFNSSYYYKRYITYSNNLEKEKKSYSKELPSDYIYNY